ncbi:MAG: hypothetical protein HPY45_15475 [Anaerolineae bacterium]|nr:hypothetical protein [Anaerolineae bacterium]
MFMLLFVLHDPELLEEVLDAWENAGVSGITILPSTGLSHIRQKHSIRDDLPLIPSMENILNHIEHLNRTIFSIVESQEIVQRVVAATESITGSLCNPDTGILAVIPLAGVYGLKPPHAH